jgi:hypothetical protein
MRILFAIGIAVSALLLTSCSNPDTSGGVTMQRDTDNSLPYGNCRGPGYQTYSTNPQGLVCGFYVSQNANPESSYYIMPNANLTDGWAGTDMQGWNLKDADLTGADLTIETISAKIEGWILCNTTMPNGTVNNSGC